MSILSSPLPTNYVIPATLAAFVLQIVDCAVRSPSAETLEPLYAVLKGTKADMMEVLQPKKLLHLQHQLIKLLRNFDDHAVNLLSLAIFAALCSNKDVRDATGDSMSSQGSQSIVEYVVDGRGHIYDSARKFFNANKAHKTLELVILRASWSCSGNLGPTDAIASLGLVKDILDAIAIEQKIEWAKNNMSKVRKLYDKIRRPDIDHRMRIAAFEVVSSLSGAETLPRDLIKVVENLLQRPSPSYDIEKVLVTYAGNFSEAFIYGQISRALQAATACSPAEPEGLVEINGLRKIIGCLIAAAETSSRVRQTLLVALSSNDLQDSLRRFLSNTSPDTQSIRKHELRETCVWTTEGARWSLIREICVLLLRCALCASSEVVAIDSCLATALLDKAIEQSSLFMPCDLFKIRTKPQLREYVSKDDFEVSPTSRNWKALLKNKLDLDSAHCHELIVQRVNAVCGDFEARCDNVEQPLREKQEHAQNLNSQLTSCKALCAELESQARERSLLLDRLENRDFLLINEKNSAETKARGVSEELQSVSRQLSLAYQQAADAAKAAKEAMRQQELGSLATMIAKDEILESEMERIASMEIRQIHMSEDLGHAHKELEVAKLETFSVLETLEERAVHIAELESTVRSRNKDLEQRINVEAQHADHIERLKCEVDKLLSEIETLKTREKAKVDNLNRIVSDLEGHYQHYISCKEAEMLRQRLEHETMVTAMQRDLEKASNENARLTALHEEQHATLSEAQYLFTKLVRKTADPPTIAVSSESTASSEPKARNESTEHVHQENNRSLSQRSCQSSTSTKSGSIPKRARIRQSSRTPSIHPTKLGVVGRRSKVSNNVQEQTTRYSLQDHGLGARRNDTVAPYQRMNNRYEDDLGSPGDKEPILLEKMHDVLFEDSNVFTSTDYHEAEIKEISAIAVVDDTTTVEF